MHKLSVVVPVYQDELSIRQNFLALKASLDRAAHLFRYEIVLVNDGSRDNSILLMEQLHAEFPECVGVMKLSAKFRPGGSHHGRPRALHRRLCGRDIERSAGPS